MTERKYCGKTQEEMSQILYTLCDIEDKIPLTPDEEEAFDIAVQCVSTIRNRMSNNKEIIWDQ